MKHSDQSFCLITLATAFIVTAIVYAPMFTGKVPFPAHYIFEFPAFATIAPTEGLLPHPNIGDLVSSFYPYRTLAARALREGTLPLWNSHMLSGAPFQATGQPALFYPGNFMFYFLPVPLAWTISFILRRVLAVFFTALFVRKIG